MANRKEVYEVIGKLAALSLSAESGTVVIPIELAGEIMDLLEEPEPKLINNNEIGEYIGKVVWIEFKDLLWLSPVEIACVTDSEIDFIKLPDEWYIKSLKPGDMRIWSAKPSAKQCCDQKWE